MKSRIGFVSNSSTSSYVCYVCNETEEGRDASPGELGMKECVHGHTFHENCSNFPISLYDDKLTDTEVFKAVQCFASDYSSLPHYSKHDLEEQVEYHIQQGTTRYALLELIEDFEDDVPSIWCPICNFDILDQQSILKFLLYKIGLCKREFQTLLRREYTNLQGLEKYLEEHDIDQYVNRK